MTWFSCFLLIICATLVTTTMAEPPSPESHLEYTTVTGFFLQDDPATDPAGFDYASTSFGLINQTYDTDPPHGNEKKSQWERFTHKLHQLNAEAGPDTDYKLLFLGRHGEGYHNLAEAYYGTEAWDCYWSTLDGNGTITWSDAHLTETGIAQAGVARDTWAKEMKHGIPLPESYYSSPLDRCLWTAKVTFGDLKLPHEKPFKPVVKELLRETIGIHTCDRRSSASYISTTYPTYNLEPHFSPTDPLWQPDKRESNSARTLRLTHLLDDIFTHDRNVVLSLTAHSGAITSILEAVGHRKFALQTGGIIPVLVRAERKGGKRVVGDIDPPTGVPECGEGVNVPEQIRMRN